MVASLPTAQAVLTPLLIATVDDVPITVYSASTNHGVERDIGTASITAAKPEYTITELRDRWLNRPVEIQMGYGGDTGLGASRIFSGRIEAIDRGFDRGGFSMQMSCTGWSKLLDFPAEEDIVFPGGTSLYQIARSLCELRQLPMYGGELITYLDGTTPITLGGVSYFDGGNIVIPRRTSPLQWLTSTLQLFGYYAFDRPDGMFWWQRVAGTPAASPVRTFTQGNNVFQMDRSDGIREMATWIDVTGASGTDDDGIAVKVRSFPAVVPPDTGGFVTPPGFKRTSISNNLLVTQELADEARNVHEINISTPSERDSWRFLGNNVIQPGAIVRLNSTLLELDDADRWVMNVDHSASRSGIRTTWSGWSGSGTPLAAGDDSVTIPVFTDAVHLGDETLAHYAHPSPEGFELSFNITIPDEYTAMLIELKLHGANSFLIGGDNTDSEVSKIEVWQGGGEDPIGTGVLPMSPENLALELDYTDLANWTSHRIPIPGRLVAGIATVKFVSGIDSRISEAFQHDDYECRDVSLVVTGAGSPVLPGGVS